MAFVAVFRLEPVTCDHGRETVVQTGEAPSLGRKPGRLRWRIGLTPEVSGYSGWDKKPFVIPGDSISTGWLWWRDATPQGSRSGAKPSSAWGILPQPPVREARERELLEKARPANQTAVLLIAHGSRHESANDDLRELAQRMAAAGTYPIVEACFLELAEPDIASGGGRCVSRGASRVLMVPYFLSAGVHLLRDLTAAREELSGSYPQVEFRLGPPLGPHPLLDELVTTRARELDSGDAVPVSASTEKEQSGYARRSDSD